MHTTEGFLLASLATAYPDKTFGDYMRMLLDDQGLALPEGLKAALERLLSETARLDDLRSEYVDTFDRGRKDHLGRFPAASAERPGVAGSELYSRVFDWCRDLVADECARLGVEVIPANWIAGQSEKESHERPGGLPRETLSLSSAFGHGRVQLQVRLLPP